MTICVRVLYVIASLALALGQGTAIAATAPPGDDVEWVIDAKATASSSSAKAITNAFDIDGIAVFEISGGYDRGNTQARIDVARRYFERYHDEHDLLLVFSNFEFDTGEASAFANVIKNDVQGLGLPLYDSSAAFGSASGRLHNYIDMAALSRWEFNPSSPGYGLTLDIAAHEVMHRWVAHPKFMRNGQPSEDLLGRDLAHWSFFLDSDASIMYGADWRLGSDGQFEAIDIRHRLSPLDLYLAGLFAVAEVPEMTLIRGGAGASAQDFPVLGFKTPGSAETVNIAQIIAANGERVPDVTLSAKKLSAGLVLLLRPGQAYSEQAIFNLQRFAQDFETRFAAMTRGRASLSIRNQPLQTVAAIGAPAIISGGALCTTCSLDIAQAKVWLSAQQRASDGAFVDKDLNALPTSAAALRAMTLTQFGSDAQRASAGNWLHAFHSRQFDDLAWKSLAGIDASIGVDEALFSERTTLIATQAPGLLRNFAASAWDTAAALQSYWAHTSSQADRALFLARLRAMQNADGGFSVSPGGVSHVGATAWVLHEVSALSEAAGEEIATAAAAWLLAQRGPDGAFGTGSDAVLPTAWAIAGLVRLETGIDVAPSISFLRTRQSLAGDWNGSVFTTAEVIRVLAQIDKPNLSFDTAITATPAAPISGDRVRLLVRVRNDGIAAEGVTLAWYLGDPDQSGSLIGTQAELGMLGAGQSLEVSTDWDSTGHAGARQITAVLDRADLVDELNERDNRSNLMLDVGNLPSAPDAALVRERFTLTPAAANVFPLPVSLSGELSNLGGAALTAMPVVVYSVRNGVRVELARSSVDVAAQASKPVQLNFTLQRTDPLNLALVADPDNAVAEIRETNNELLFALSSANGIDLAIAGSDLVQLTQPAVSGQPTRFRLTARNNGASASPNFVLVPQIRQGTNTYPLGEINLQLDAGASSEREVAWTANTPGAATLEVVLDPSALVEDADRSNNAATLAFEVIDPSAPNLAVVAQSIQLAPAPLDQSQPASLQATVRNLGAALTSDFEVAVSTGGESGARTELARLTVAGGLAAGAERIITIALPALPTAGDRYFFVTIDPDAEIVELNEGDNTGFLRQHVRSIADASVTIASVQLIPSTPIPGQNVTAQVTVRNLGEQPLQGLQARFFDGTPQAGNEIPPTQTAATIAGGATGQLNWSWTYAPSGSEPIFSVQLDPDNQIAELREDNNLAVLRLQALADHYATEPYISPNDDGIKESTQVVFRQLSSAPAVVDVRDIGGQVVRTYTPEEFIGGNGYAVLWDGRDNDGNVVVDGRYRVQASTGDGNVLAEVIVVVDTNRSSILEAMGTSLEKYTELGLSELDVLVPPADYIDQDLVILRNPPNLATADPFDELPGLYRFDVLLKTLDPVVDAGWLLAQGSNALIREMHWAASGEYLVVVVRAGNRDTVWRLRADGRNAALRLSGPDPVRENRYAIRSPDEAHVVVWNNSSPAPYARYFDLRSGDVIELLAAGAGGDLARVFEDGFVVGYSNTQLYFVFFDGATPVRTVMDAQQSGYIAHLGARGVLVHRVLGSEEAIEWRSLRDAASRVILSAPSHPTLIEQRRCRLTPENSSWFGGELLIVNHHLRDAALIDVDTGAMRTIELNPIERVGGYREQHALNFGGDGSPDAQLLRVERSGSCTERLTTSQAAKRADDASDIRGSANGKRFDAQNLLRGREPAHSLVREGEIVVVFTIDNEAYPYFVEGAHSAYALDRARGTVSLLGSYSNWPLLDAEDQSRFTAIFDEGEVPSSDLEAQPQALIAEFERRTSVSNPFLRLSDGSGIASAVDGSDAASYGVFAPGGYPTGAVFPYPRNFLGVWESEQHLYGRNTAPVSSVLWLYSSLANQATRLRARGSNTGIDLVGVAADQNFLQFVLEWANPATPEIWNSIGPAIQEAATDGELMSWTPPSAGQYLLRLSAEDKAGNVRTASTRAISPAAADIANPRLSSRYVSPNGDGIKDQLVLAMDVLRPTNLRFEVRDAQGALIRSEDQQIVAVGPLSWTWNGQLATGAVAADGRYRVSVNTWFASGFTIDTTPPAMTLQRSPAEVRAVVGSRVATIDSSQVTSKISWAWVETNPHAISLQRGEGAVPANWETQIDALSAEGEKKLDKDDGGNYRIVAEDLAGNRAVSSVTGLLPPDLGLVGRTALDSDAPIPAWGCSTPIYSHCAYQRDQTGALYYAGGSVFFVESETLVALDMYLGPGTPSNELSLRYRVDQFGSVATNGPWQNLPIAAIERSGTELRLRAVVPTLPLQSIITVQAATRLDNGTLLYSEATAFEIAGIYEPTFAIVDAECRVPSDIDLDLPASLVCVQEALLGLGRVPTLTVVESDGTTSAVQSPLRISDGLVSFELPDPNCSEVVARMKSASGRSYESRSPCPGADVITSAEVVPVPLAVCDAPPSHQMQYRVAALPLGNARVTRLSAELLLPDESRRPLFDLVDPPAMQGGCRPDECLRSGEASGRFDASALSDGRYGVAFVVHLSSGGSVLVRREFSVDRTPSSIAIRKPQEGTRSCVVRSAQGRAQIPVDIESSDPSGLLADIGIASDRSDEFVPPRPPEPGKWQPYGISRESGFNALTTIQQSTGDLLAYDETNPLGSGYIMRYATLNWGGAPQCRFVRFSADGAVDSSLEIDPGVARRRPATPPPSGAPPALPVINPIGAQAYRALGLRLIAREPLLAHFELWPYPSEFGQAAIAVLGDAVAYEQGSHAMSWNGRLSSGDVVPDGIYRLRVVLSDDCGNVGGHWVNLIIDTSNPEVQFQTPVLNQSLATLFVPIAITAEDLSGGAFELSAVATDSITITGGVLHWPLPGSPAIEAAWNRGDLTGPVVLRVVATDVVGNRSVTELPIQLGPRPSHLFDDAAVLPELFSPNEDGQFDRVDIRYALAANADVSVRVLRPNGSVLTVLQNAEPKLAGNHALQWFGQGLPATAADGSYRIELHAVSANDPLQFEDVLLSVVVDVTDPQLTMTAPQGQYSKGQGALNVAIVEPHFGSADWQFGGQQGAVFASGANTLLDLDEIAEGPHSLVLEALDRIANSARLEQALIIDRTPPTAAFGVPDENAVLGGTATSAAIDGTATDINFERYTLSIANATTPDAETVLATANTAVDNALLHTLTLSRPDDAYLLRLAVEDKATHRSVATRRIAIDNTAPIAQMTAPVDNTYVPRRLRVHGTASDTHLADYRLRLATPAQANAGLWSDILIEHSTVNDGELGVVDLTVPDGEYFLELLVRDRVQLTASQRIRIRLDSTAPAAPIQLVAHRQGDTDVVLDWQDTPAADFAGYQLYRDGAKLNTTLLPGRSYLDVNAPNGTLRYEVSALDLAGNESARSNPAIVIIDRTPPDVDLIAPADQSTVYGIVEIVGTAFSENDFDRYKLSLFNAQTQALVEVLAESSVSVRAGALATWDTRTQAEGASFRLLLEAWDQSGNRAEDAIVLIVDNLPPAAPTGLVAVDVNGDGQINWDANSEPDLLGYVLLRDGSPVNSSGSFPDDLRVLALPTNAYLDPRLSDGLHTWIVFAIDRAGNLSPPSAPDDLSISRRAPDIRIATPVQDYRFDNSVGVLATSDDTDIAQVWFDVRAVGASGWTALGSPVLQAPYTVTWTPGALPYGDYEIRAQARDTGGMEDATPAIVRVRYTDLDPPPQVLGLVAHADGGSAQLGWNAVAVPDLAKYLVERSQFAASEFSAVSEVPAGSTTFIDNGLDDGIWYYRIKAEDSTGNIGAASAVDSARVFSLRVQTPFSPIRAATTTLVGSTPVAGNLRAMRDQGGNATELLRLDIAEGAFSLPALSLLAGENQLLLRVTDSEQNLSRTAEAWVSSSADPSAPSGLAVAVNGHEVTANWNANPEPNIVGYRLFRRDFPVRVERDLDDLVAVGVPDDQPGFAVDNDAATAWASNSYFPHGVIDDSYLELTTSTERQLTGVRLVWLDDRRPQSFDVLAYSGRAWVRLASVSTVLSQQTVRFDAPYRSNKLRIVPTNTVYGLTVALAEVQVSEQPLIDATSYVDNVIDGRYPYEVTAVNDYGFEGPRSLPATADVGDATPPEPVVLSGQVQGRDAVLNWTASTSLDVARYRLLRDGQPRALIEAPLTTYTDSNLANGLYSYTVIALDAFDNASAASNTVPLSISAQGPGLPQNLRVLPVQSGAALDVSWQQGGGAASVRYALRRSEDQSGPFVQITETALLEYRDRPLSNGRRYWYTVEAFDTAGNASGQTAPVSGVPLDQQAPLPPRLTFPVHEGETIDLNVAQILVAGVSEPASRIDIRRAGSNVTQTNARSSDALRRILNGFVEGRLRAAPSGSWMYGEDVRQIYDTDQGNQSARTAFGVLTDWTRDDRIVHRDGNGQWQSSALSGADDRSLELPLTNVENARFSSDLRYVLALGEYPVNGTATRALWLLDRTLSTTRRVLTIAPDTVDFGSIVFAEHAGFAAWRSSSGELMQLSLGTALARSLAAAIEPARIDLSSRDGEALYVRLVDAVPTVHRVQASGTARVLGAGTVAVWSPDARLYAIVEANGVLALHSAEDDALLRRVNTESSAILDMQWTQSGRLLAVTADGPRALDPEGYFRSAAITLQPGENRLSLFASDSAGQGQASNEPGTVRVANGQTQTADLAVQDSDIRFLPALGAPGQNFTAQITVRNLGTGTSVATPTRLRLTSPNGAVRVLSGTGNVPPLAAGGNAALSVALGQLDVAGSYWLSVELLVSAADANLSNHTASQRLIVSAGAAPVLELSADAASFAPGSDATGRVSVRNAGTAFSGSVRLRVLSQGGDVITDLPGMPISGLAFGAEAAQAWRWSTDQVFAGGYRVVADLLDEQNRLLSTRQVDFAIAVVRDLRLSVQSDRDAYTLGDTVRLNATLDYHSGNAALSSAALRLRLLDPVGTEVFATTRALATLLPGYRIQIPGTWIAAGTGGVYSIRAELQENGSLTALAQGSFLVSPPNAALAVTGSIAPAPAPLIAGRPGRIEFALNNPSSSSLSVEALRLRLLSADGSQEIAARTISGTAAAQGRLDGLLDLGEVTQPVGDYLAVLDWRATPASALATLATRSVSVVDGIAPSIVLRTPESNAWVRGDAPLAAQVTDAHSGVDRVEISVDGGAWRTAPQQGQGLYGGDAAGLTDGTHRFQIRARDRAGNESVSAERSFQVDNTAPLIEITGVSDGDIVAHSVTPVVSIVEAHLASSTIALNAAAFVSGTTVTADGSYLLSVVARDLAGNVAAASLRFQIDTVAPTVVFVTPLNGDETTQASIEARVQTEPGIAVQLSAGVHVASANADASGVATFAVVPLTFGSNTLMAVATDLAGNASAPVSVQITRRDNSGAVLVGSLVATAPVYASGTPAVLNWQVVNPGATAANAQALRIRAVHIASAQVLGTDSVTADVPGNGQATGVSTFATTGAPLGRYIATLSVQVGSDSVQLATAEFDVLDSQPPLLVLNAPANGALINTSVRVLATASDALGTVNSVHYRLDGAAPVAMTAVVGSSNDYESSALDLLDGGYQVLVTASDNAGNSSTSPVHAFTVDRTPPQIQISDVADGGAYNVPVVPIIQISDLHPGTSTITLDGQPYVSGTTVDTEGTHVLRVDANDAAGNSATRSLSFRIDRTAPVIAFSFPLEGAVVATPLINVGGLTEAFARVEFRIAAVNSTVFADDLGGFVVPGVTLQVGGNVLQARAIDALGNASGWISRNVEYRPNAGASLSATLTLSTVDLPLGDVLTANYALSNTGSIPIQALPMRVLWVRVADQQQLTDHRFAIDLAPTASTSGSVALQSATTLPGAHVVVLEGQLTDGNGVQSWQVLATEQAIVRDVLAPAVSVLAPAAGSYVDTGFTLRVAASDVHSTVANVQGLVAAAPIAMTPGANVGEYEAIVTAASEGPLQLSARAVDSAGNAAEADARQVIVDLLPPAINITGVAEGALVNQIVTLQVAVTDISPVQTTITLDGQPFNTGSTVAADGPHLLRATATDALGRHSEALRSFTIDRTPPPIQINVPVNGAVIFADSTRVVGATEALASVALNVGAFNATLNADANGIFSLDNVPLVPGQNRIAARATDRAGNVGNETAIQVERRGQPVVALQGNLALTVSEWANGTALASSFLLDNIGTADLMALPVRIEARRRDSQQLLQSADFSFDLLAGAERTQTFNWATGTWGLGIVDITLTADLPESRVMVVLDTHALLLIDREAPAIQFESPAANARLRAGDPVRVLASDRLSSITSTELSIDNGPWIALSLIDALAGRYGTALPVLSLGPHQLSARTQDAAGNRASSASLPILVVGDLPLTVSAPLNGSSTAAAIVDFIGNTSPNVSVRLRRGAQEWLTQSNAAGAFTVPAVPLIAGANAFTVRAEDAFGNFSATLAINVTATGIIELVPVPVGGISTWILLIGLMLILAQRTAARWRWVPSKHRRTEAQEHSA